jgi:hypothetical protein
MYFQWDTCSEYKAVAMNLEEILDSCAAHFAKKYPDMNFVIVGRQDGVIMHSNTPMTEDDVIHLCMAAVETEALGKKRFIEAHKL